MNRVIRYGVFETNSSSTHALSLTSEGLPAVFEVQGRRERSGLLKLNVLTSSWEAAVQRAQRWLSQYDSVAVLPEDTDGWLSSAPDTWEYCGSPDRYIITIAKRAVHDPEELLRGSQEY